MSHYKICFKKYKLCVIAYHQWTDFDTLIQIGKLMKVLGWSLFTSELRRGFAEKRFETLSEISW